jgi:hypothetical protein
LLSQTVNPPEPFLVVKCSDTGQVSQRHHQKGELRAAREWDF